MRPSRDEVNAILAARAAAAAPPPSSSVPGQFASNVPVGAASMIDLLLSGASKIPGVRSFVEPWYGPGMLAEGMARGIPAPAPGPQTWAAGAGRGVGMALPTAPIALATGGAGVLPMAGRAGLELASGATGQMASEAAARRGYGPLGQFGAGLVGGFAPDVAVGLGGAAIRGIAGARGSAAPAERLAGRALSKPSNLRRFEVRKTAIDELAGRLERDFPSGAPAEALAAHEAAAATLADDVDRAFARAGDIPGISTAKLGLTYRGIVEDAGTELAESVPTNIGAKIDAYRGETSLYALRKLRRAISRDLDAASKGVARDPERFRYLTRLKQSVDETIHDVASRGTDAAESINALDNALALASKQGRLYGASTQTRVAGRARAVPNPVTKAVERFPSDPYQAIRAAVLSRDTKAALSTLRETLQDDPAAMRGVGNVIVDEVLGAKVPVVLEEGYTGVGRGVVSQAIGRLQNPRDRRLALALDEWFGPGASQNMVKLLKGMRTQVALGRATKIPSLEPVNDPVLAIFHLRPIEAARRALRLAGHSNATRSEARAYFMAALVDEELKKALTEPLMRYELPRWAEHVNRILTRTARAGAGIRDDQEERR